VLHLFVFGSATFLRFFTNKKNVYSGCKYVIKSKYINITETNQKQRSATCATDQDLGLFTMKHGHCRGGNREVILEI